MKKLILMLVVVLMTSAFLSADLYIKQEVKSSGIMGRPDSTTVTEQWFGKDKIATVSKDMNIIIDSVAKKIYFITPSKKTYVESSLPLDLSNIMDPNTAAVMKPMMDSMTVSVTPNNKTQKIENLNCNGYDTAMTMKMMGMEIKTNMTIWASTEVPFDWKALIPMQTELMKVFMNAGENVMNEFKKVNGFQIASEGETEVMGQKMKTSTKVLEINPNKAAPADVYTLPAGYKKMDFLESQMGGK